jgi:hypothetical protein
MTSSARTTPTRSKHQERLADLSEPVIGHADHRSLGDGWQPGLTPATDFTAFSP